MIRSVLGLVIVVLLCGCWVARGQGDKVTIRTVSAQTADLLTFRISLPQRLYGPRQNVVISYNVTNYSLPCLGKLEHIAKILTVGTLIVEVKSP